MINKFLIYKLLMVLIIFLNHQYVFANSTGEFYIEGNNERFSTLMAAELKLKTLSDAHAVLQLKTVTKSSTQIIYNYSASKIAPNQTAIDYGYDRCNTTKWGYATEATAINVGANGYYPSSSGCPKTSYKAVGWGTNAVPSYGSCGSTKPYPTTKNSITPNSMDLWNTNQYLVYSYTNFGDGTCTKNSDGLTVYRNQTLTCSKGYLPQAVDPGSVDSTWSSVECINNTTARIVQDLQVDPLKNISSCGVGNPISPATGNKYQEEVDYNGAGYFPIKIKRTYNSVWANYNNSNLMPPTIFGYQWVSNFSTKIIDTQGNLSDIAVIRPNGRLLHFYKTSSDTFVSDSDIQDKLTRLKDANGKTLGWYYNEALTANTEGYNSNGNLSWIKNRAGQTQLITLSTDGLPQAIKDPQGRSVLFTYNDIKQITSIKLPNNTVIQYFYNAKGLLERVLYSDNTERKYLYEDNRFPFYLTGIVDANGKQFAFFTYDAQGRAISTEHANHVEHFGITYNSDDTSTVTDPLNTDRNYSYSNILGMRKTSEVTQPCTSCNGSTQKLLYDSNGNISSRIDFKGNRTNYIYDMARNLETQRVEGLAADGSTTALTRTISTQWHATLRLPRKVAEPRKLTTYTFSEDGLNCGPVGSICRKTVQETTDTTGAVGLNVTASGGRVWTYTYNAVGQLLTVDGSRTDVTDKTTYTYYSDTTTTHNVYDLWKLTNALGHVTTISNYDANGRPLTSVDANNVTTQYSYNNRGWLSKTVVASTKTTIYAYNFLGKLQTLTLPDGRTYTYGYDDAHRLISITSNSGETITYTLDNLGNKTEEKITNSSGVVEKRLTQEFDALGNIAKSIESVQGVNAATTYTYDDMGNLSTETNPSGNVKTYTYDALSRLATAQEVLNGRNIINFYGYDATNQQTSAQAPNNAKTQYTYNGFGEVLTETSPDRGLVTYTYDSAGNVKTRKDARNKTLTYTYDALNRVLTSTDGTNTISYSYDLNPTGITCGKGLGRLCRVVDSSGVNDFVYNVLGQLTNKTSIVGTTTIPWLMSYDLNSKPIIIATGNRYIMHERDAAQRLLKVSTLIGGNEQYLLNNATYQADGNIKTLSYGNGETVTHTYDLSGHRLSTTRVGVGINDTFTWLTNGWLQKRVTTGTGGATRTYTYDSLGRLVSEAGTPLTQSFGYDDNGNRLSNGSNTYAYTANTNAMSKRQASAVTRDAAGNTLTDGTGRTLTWDSWGNLSSVTKAGITTSYVYNYRHQRVKKTLSNGTVTLYHYDESDRLIMETSGTGIVQAMYFYLDDNTPFALMYAANSPNNNTAQDQIIYLHTDHLGTPRLATDSTKKLIWRWESDAFGSTLANQDPDADGKATIVNLRFPGQYYDAESGLHYNWNRYYDPASGRYVSSDPIGLRGGRNTYGYVKQNPLLNFDLKGLSISTGDIIDGAKKGKGWWDNATDFAGIWSDLTTPDPNPPCGPGLSEEKGQQLLGGLGNLIGFVIGFFNPAQDAVDYGAPNGFFGTKPGLVANAGDKLSGRGRYIDGIVDSADPPIYHQ